MADFQIWEGYLGKITKMFKKFARNQSEQLFRSVSTYKSDLQNSIIYVL